MFLAVFNLCAHYLIHMLYILEWLFFQLYFLWFVFLNFLNRVFKKYLNLKCVTVCLSQCLARQIDYQHFLLRREQRRIARNERRERRYLEQRGEIKIVY